MSARHINPNQLAMFMPARKLAELRMGDIRPGENKEDMFARKRAEIPVKGWDFSGGIREPVEHWHSDNPRQTAAGVGTRLMDGHHRLAYALGKDPNMEVPVQHTDAMSGQTMQTHREMAGERNARKQRLAGRRPLSAEAHSAIDGVVKALRQ